MVALTMNSIMYHKNELRTLTEHCNTSWVSEPKRERRDTSTDGTLPFETVVSSLILVIFGAQLLALRPGVDTSKLLQKRT